MGDKEGGPYHGSQLLFPVSVPQHPRSNTQAAPAVPQQPWVTAQGPGASPGVQHPCPQFCKTYFMCSKGVLADLSVFVKSVFTHSKCWEISILPSTMLNNGNEKVRHNFCLKDVPFLLVGGGGWRVV